MQLKKKDGTTAVAEFSDEEFLELIKSSLVSIRRRSAIIECAVCGQRFLVNTQDFHQVTKCSTHAQSV
jgi:hypothetical protein